jgi:hypothetical protein
MLMYVLNVFDTFYSYVYETTIFSQFIHVLWKFTFVLCSSAIASKSEAFVKYGALQESYILTLHFRNLLFRDFVKASRIMRLSQAYTLYMSSYKINLRVLI